LQAGGARQRRAVAGQPAPTFSGDRRSNLLNATQFGDGAKQFAAMSERRHADFFEVLVRQIAENGKVDFIFSKALGVLPESELL
jgi:hypothetical protein